MPAPRMTERRRRIFTAILKLRTKHQKDPDQTPWPPTFDEIAVAANVPKATVFNNITELERFGYVKRTPGRCRSLQVLRDAVEVEARA
jgi:DNA-binding MarR family transcriptional regulator